MSDFWEKKLLGDVIELKYGIGLPKRNRKYGNFPVYGSGGIADYHNEPFIKGPGIIVGRKGSIGTIYYEKSDFCPIDTVFYVHNKDVSNDLKFIYYLLTQINLHTLNTDAAVPGLNRNVAHTQEIELPDPNIQRKIASILSAYDDLIENNTHRIQILEEMAQRIYREWFVHSRYPDHESDKLVESELGIIPVGWEVKKLREFVLNVRQSERAGDHLLSIPYVPIDCIPRKSLFLNSAKPGFEAKSSLISFQKYDVLFGAMRSYFHKVVISPFNGTTRTTCFVLRPIDPGYYAFTVLTLFQESTIDFANSHSRGSTMPYAVWDDGLAEMPAIYPSKEVALDFNKIVEPMLKRIALGFFEQKNLRQTRDFLLPKLISGKIDVSELDIDIGEG